MTSTFAKANWAKGLDVKGQPIPDPGKYPQIDAALVGAGDTLHGFAMHAK